MMASAILVVGFTGLIHGITIGSEALDTSRKQQVATQIMDAEIERLRSGPWSTIAGLAASGALTISDTGALSCDPTLFALTNYTVVSSDDNTALIALAKGFTCSYVLTRLRDRKSTRLNSSHQIISYAV